MAFFLAPLIPLLIKAIATCACVGGTCYCAKKLHDAYKSGQKTKRLKYEYTLGEKRAARENNEKLQPKLEEKQNEHNK